jgi:hypothetical protein
MKTFLLSLSLLAAAPALAETPPVFAEVVHDAADHDPDPCLVERDAYAVANGGEEIARYASQDGFYALQQVSNDLHLRASDLYHIARIECRRIEEEYDHNMEEAWLDVQYSAQRFSYEWQMNGAYYSRDYRITQALQRLQYDYDRLARDFEAPNPNTYVDVDCGSHNYQYRACPTGLRIQNVVLLRQLSTASCQQGYTWGYNNNVVWVDRGCRGIFRVYGIR